MALLWADFPSGQQGIYGTTALRLLDGIYGSVDAYDGVSDAKLEEDPDPNVSGIALRLEVDTITPSQMRYVMPAATPTAGLAFRLWMNNLPFGSWGSWRAPLWRFRTPGNGDICAFTVLPTGQIQAARTSSGGTVLGTTAAPVLTAASWNHVETKIVRVDSSSSTIEVRVNGITVLNLTGIDLGATNPQIVGFGSQAWNFNNINGCYGWYKDVIIWDGTGTENNDFFGSVSVRDLYVNSDIALNWTPSTGGNGWSLIDETTPNDADYIQASDPPPSPYVASLTDLPEDVTSVRGLISIARAAKTDGGDCNLQISLTPDNTNWDAGADRPLTTAYTYWRDISEVSPATSIRWTPVEVNNAYVRANRTL